MFSGKRLFGLLAVAALGLLTATPARADEPQEVKITLSEWKIEPNSITVPVGKAVQFTVTNVGRFPHDFRVEGEGVSFEVAGDQTIALGETRTFTYTFAKAGTFQIWCPVGNHRQQGMEGRLTVTALESTAAMAQTPSIRILSPQEGQTIAGSEVELKVEVIGFAIKRPDGTKVPGEGHLQVFVDREPPSGTAPVPLGVPNIIHTTATSLAVKDLAPGQHTLWVALAYGDHSPHDPSATTKVSFTTAAPAQLPKTGDSSLPGLPLLGLALALGLGLMTLGFGLRRKWAR